MSTTGENWEASCTSTGSADWESAAGWGEPAVAFFGSLTAGAASGQGAQRALAESFTHATVVASLYALGAMVLTVLLVPFLPGRRQDEERAR
jgi:hypothetical protein